LNISRPQRVSHFNSMLHLKMKIKLSIVALAALLFAGLPLASSFAQIGISVAIAPPEIPIYEQPYCPVEGYIWTPPYWAYADADYYLVPGVWVAPPRVGFLWTPGYWGFNNGVYLFNEGYWGPTVGFYGGINYGFGYGGQGYYGGEWAGGTFRYNTAVTRVDTTVIRNTYVNNAVVNNAASRASFNGPGGATAKATAKEQAAAKAEHVPATAEQHSRVEAAKNDPALHVANNHGKPKAEAIKALDSKSGAQPAGAAAGGPAGAKKQAGTEKLKGGAGQGAIENSAFSHKQGDATTHTKGSQNNAYGKAQPGGAHGLHPAAKGPTGPHAMQHEQIVSHRPPPGQGRPGGPGASGHVKGPTGQPEKKNKKAPNEGPDGGQ
jgi:hypothetical protein